MAEGGAGLTLNLILTLILIQVMAEGGAGWGCLLSAFAFGTHAADRTIHVFEYEEAAIEYIRHVQCKDNNVT